MLHGMLRARVLAVPCSSPKVERIKCMVGGTKESKSKRVGWRECDVKDEKATDLTLLPTNSI